MGVILVAEWLSFYATRTSEENKRIADVVDGEAREREQKVKMKMKMLPLPLL